ncbi:MULTISPECIES: electron transport complex subunit RsxA [unclassified Candidatus Frackibacter]|uniref:electron transport complex subunit RsxA n=1 Tax=unclassified Candidatus Frackibacter TaxID=2648818 RepID=UPI0007966B73|nr:MULTISPECIES: electron transport complex subunit RsxA [unclassified Candidatus Frackibacter]KXS37602.1 MAG: electron transport complex protein RnfA [Candidatus Frackibacter sp. T328-2]SDC41714.1 electron transport complex protein RnfA [Candidatus Frackibacter sp. WG11]SEM59306.1 electron transport complex protein RnfA [Candidatus Frackibacter sp. WG12]SFL62790.1 electron transport complex protein RnfA [Candidatus Frackibacter sp. WG13]
MELLLVFLGASITNNFILARFLGICPFLGVSKEVPTAFSMGLATTFVMTTSAMVVWFVQTFILEKFGLPYLQYVAFILVISAFVQLTEMAVRKISEPLYKALGIFLPLITTNCAILGLALLIPLKGYSFIESTIFGFGAGVGFTLAMVLMAGMRERLAFADVPEPLQGAPMTLIIAGMMAMAFMGFSGMIAM